MEDKGSRSSYELTYLNLEGYSSGLDYYEYMNKLNSDDAGIMALREGVIGDFYAEYKNKISSESVMEILKKYGVNYIVWDKNKYPEWDLSVFPDIREVFSYKDIFIYKLK
jgi:hypothetical protein